MNNFPNCKCSSVPEACVCTKDCPYQDYLVENGFVISCDSCGHAGHTDSNHWEGLVNDEGMCFVYCLKCWEKIHKETKELDSIIEWLDESVPNHGFFVDNEKREIIFKHVH